VGDEMGNSGHLRRGWNYIWQTIVFRIDGSYEQVVDHRPFASSVKVMAGLRGSPDIGGVWLFLIPLLIVIRAAPGLPPLGASRIAPR